MTVQEFTATVDRVADEGRTSVEQAGTAGELEALRTALLGRKSGRLTKLMKQLP